MKTVMAIWLSLVLTMVWMAPTLEATDGGDLVAGKCTVCHSAARICRGLGVKSQSEWARTVDRMIAKGARVNGNERAVVLAYLSGATPESAPFCR